MDGIHDLGGRQGFGPVIREENEPAFHEPWEAGVYACMVAVMSRAGLGNLDRFRHAIERMEPAAYLTHTYYGRWLAGLETMLEEEGLLDGEEIDNRMRERGGVRQGEPISRAARPVAGNAWGEGGESTYYASRRQVADEARFQVAEPVRTIAHGTAGHTRLPAYARDKRGEIQSLHGAWVFPDTHAHGVGEHPCHLYTVRFSGTELWGAGSGRAGDVCIDLFEPYLCKLEG